MSEYSRSALKTAKNNAYSDSLGSGATTRSVHRAAFEDVADSAAFLEDFAPVTASGSATYTASLIADPGASYTKIANRFILVKFTSANTGAATLNLNSRGAVAIKKNSSEALAAGDIVAGSVLLLAYDGTNFQIVGAISSTAPSSANDTDIKFWEQDDFVWTSLYSFAVANSGTSSGLSSDSYGVNSTERVFGSIYLATGTDTAGRCILYKMSAASTAIFGNHALRLRFRDALHTLSDGTDTYTAYIGFGDNIGSGDMTDGAYFRYTHSVNSGKWECVTAQGGTRTATDSGVTADTTFMIFDIRVNEAGTSVEFYINGTLRQTHTTNIPGAAQYTGILMKIEKSAGTTSRRIYADWYDLLVTRSASR